jgi:hypothetical protein
MFEVKKEISFSYQGKIDKFLVGSKISQQELIEKLNQANFEFFCKKEFLKELPKEIQELEIEPREEIQETQYRFEISGYKQKDGSAFRKNSIYTETEIKEAGLSIEELFEKEAITWLK